MAIESVTSRRGFIFAGSAMCLLPAMMQGQPSVEHCRDVGLIYSQDANFEEVMNRKFGNLSSDPRMNCMKPFSLILVNNSTLAITAYSLEWTFVVYSKAQTVTLYHYAKPSARTPGDGMRVILKPGESSIVSPFFRWSESYLSLNPTRHLDSLTPHDELRTFLFQELPNITHSEAVVDAVIYENETAAGTDRAGLVPRYNVISNARHDEAVSIYKLMQRGADPSETISKLEDHADGFTVEWENRRGRTYYKARQTQAALLLRLHRKHGYSRLARYVHQLARQKRYAITIS